MTLTKKLTGEMHHTVNALKYLNIFDSNQQTLYYPIIMLKKHYPA